MNDETLIHRFGDVAAACPEHAAVLTEARQLTYAELAGLAGGYAEVLVAAGVRAGDRVGLLTA
ncbi:AMP-binding protein, partial [Micromonospora azadirachtae]